MPSCPSCNKFCGLEMQDPEVNRFELTDERGNAGDCITIEYNVRIVRTSECCGSEVKEGDFDDSVDLVVEEHYGEGHELELQEDGCETLEEGGSRYAKSYFGFCLDGVIRCSCGKPVTISSSSTDCLTVEGCNFTIKEKMAASEMDELN